MQLLRCRVLVTGASGGIGAAIGRELPQEGADLLLTAPALVAALARRQDVGHARREMAIARRSAG